VYSELPWFRALQQYLSQHAGLTQDKALSAFTLCLITNKKCHPRQSVTVVSEKHRRVYSLLINKDYVPDCSVTIIIIIIINHHY
jgi:hypothetical protein